MQPPAAVASRKAGPVAHENRAGKQTESATPQPATANRQPVRPPSHVIPEPVSAIPPAPAVAPPARPRVTGMRSAAEAALPVAPQPPRGREPQPAAAPPHPPVAPKESPETLLAQSWERHSNRLGELHPEAAPEVARKPEPGEIPYDAATRMSGLKNLIFSLGLKNLHQTADAGEPEAEAPPPVEPVRERPAYTRPYTPIPQHAARKESDSASPTLVTAPPEILPPQPMVEKTGKQHHTPSNSSSHFDFRDTYDDVEILPSWRGQYRRK
jgi:hypothetical protein